MSTKIEWTDETWNPIIGCSKVSPGCDNCYAEKMSARLEHIEYTEYYSHVLTDGNNGKAKWNGSTYLVESALKKPFHLKKPRRIFVCSMSDLFHENTPFEWIDRVMTVIHSNPKHTFQILTKRPERAFLYFMKHPTKLTYDIIPKNMWLGVTIENQQQVSRRISILLTIPATVRFISAEPLLGPLDILRYLTHGLQIETKKYHDYIDWVIVGGESGRNARPMHPDWVRNICNQCQQTDTPFLFKQWGEFQEGSHIKGRSYSGYHAVVFNDGSFVEDFSEELYEKSNSMVSEEWNKLSPCIMAKVGRKAAGSLLDGKEYKEFPNPKN